MHSTINVGLGLVCLIFATIDYLTKERLGGLFWSNLLLGALNVMIGL